MSTTFTAAGERRRDPLQAYRVVDGPNRGERRACDTDSFSVVQVASTRQTTAASVRVYYHLRRHAELGLVWASEDSPQLSAPYQD